MWSKKTIKLLVVIILSVTLSVITVYASPNTFKQFVMWGENKKNIAFEQIMENGDMSRQEQSSILTSETNNKLKQSDNTLKEYSTLEILNKSFSIQNHLSSHIEKLELAENEITNENESKFDGIVSQVNLQTDTMMQSLTIENELREIQMENLFDYNLYEYSLLILNNEIAQTHAAIERWKEFQNTEQNQAIKDYIQQKVDFLNNLIIILNER